MENEANTQTETQGKSETNPSTQATKNDVPYDRFAEVNQVKNQFKSENEDLKAQLSKMETAQEEQRQEAMKKNQEFETLYNETNSQLGKFKEQNEVYKNDLSAIRDGLVNQVSEDKRYITDGMSMANLQKFVQDEQMVANSNKTNSARAGEAAKSEFGGFSSWQEFAMKDPKGAEEALKSETSNYIK